MIFFKICTCFIIYYYRIVVINNIQKTYQFLIHLSIILLKSSFEQGFDRKSSILTLRQFVSTSSDLLAVTAIIGQYGIS